MTMTTDATTVDSTNVADTDAGADEHESHDVTDRQYIIIALLLAVLTAAEVAVSYMDLGAWLVPALLVMMSIKFMTIVGYFMHLKFDSPIFKGFFYLGLFLAVTLFGIMLTTFHFFIT
jgi:cytochrome c oxidase subunit 4